LIWSVVVTAAKCSPHIFTSELQINEVVVRDLGKSENLLPDQFIVR